MHFNIVKLYIQVDNKWFAHSNKVVSVTDKTQTKMHLSQVSIILYIELTGFVFKIYTSLQQCSLHEMFSNHIKHKQKMQLSQVFTQLCGTYKYAKYILLDCCTLTRSSLWEDRG